MYPFPPRGYRPGMYGMQGQGGGQQQQQQQSQPQQHYVDVALHTPERRKMGSEERVEVKNIFQGGEGGGRGYGGGGDGIGGLGAAAMVAALGGRNERGFGGCGGDGFGFGGGGGLAALLALGLLGGRDFGRGGCAPVVFDHHNGHNGHNGHDCCDQIGQQVILSKLGSIEGGITAAALQVQNAICEQTGELSGSVAALALGTQQGFANVKDAINATQLAELAAISGVKDAVQNGFALTNTNLLTGLCSVKETVVADGDRTRALLVARFQQEDATKIAAQAAEIIELRNDRDARGRHADLELKITNTNTAVAAQQQAQGQFQLQRQGDDIAHLSRCVAALVGDIQAVRQGQVIFNSGTMAASGTQAAANTKVA